MNTESQEKPPVNIADIDKTLTAGEQPSHLIEKQVQLRDESINLMNKLENEYPGIGQAVGQGEQRMVILNTPLNENTSIKSADQNTEIPVERTTYIVLTLNGFRGIAFDDYKIEGQSSQGRYVHGIDSFKKILTNLSEDKNDKIDPTQFDTTSGYRVDKDGKETVTLSESFRRQYGNIDAFSSSSEKSATSQIVNVDQSQVITALKASKERAGHQNYLPEEQQLDHQLSDVNTVSNSLDSL